MKMEMKLIIAEGEGQKIELKESLSRLNREMVAFFKCIRRKYIPWDF